jgi:hypothetical protein
MMHGRFSSGEAHLSGWLRFAPLLIGPHGAEMRNLAIRR